MKTQDHYWTDPPADELVQRHRISSGASGGATSPANRRPGLHVRKISYKLNTVTTWLHLLIRRKKLAQILTYIVLVQLFKLPRGRWKLVFLSKKLHIFKI